MSDGMPIPREHYMEKLRASRGSPFVKVVTGIRRCGKSTLMNMFADELRASGTPDDMVFQANLDDVGCGIGTHQELLEAVESGVREVGGAAVFLDEVQNVPMWELAVSTLYVRGADLYITGSNSEMLSSELSTRLSGRCLEIRVRPLAFSEYVRFRNGDADALLGDYLRRGGFPAVALAMDRMPELADDILDGIYSTVFHRDVAGRHEIRNGAAIAHVCDYLMKNVGDRTSVRKAAGYMTSKGLKMQPATVDQYIGFLEEALLFSRARRLDAKSKEYLRTADKFYAADLGVRNRRVPFSPGDLDGIVENAVYNELAYRHGTVAVCEAAPYEVDFVADPAGSPSYYQVSLSVADPAVLERELRALRAIPDNYPKTVITYERYPAEDIGGIRVVRLADWLLEDGRKRRSLDAAVSGGSPLYRT